MRGREPHRTLDRRTTLMSDTDHVIDWWAEQSRGDGPEPHKLDELCELPARGWPYQQPIHGSYHGHLFQPETFGGGLATQEAGES
jgi:hypothetical protein